MDIKIISLSASSLNLIARFINVLSTKKQKQEEGIKIEWVKPNYFSNGIAILYKTVFSFPNPLVHI